ncbi:MAG: ribosome biogenesis/translation initiation ATPase RLI [DPANN group archaeon]|nr:ribosome biogenesis/translation initiation ATPase RLI [DPANN group archaeon]
MQQHIAIVDKTKCRSSDCGKECIKYDPINRSGGEGFHLGDDGKAEIGEEQVTEMHKICAKMCPYDAIKIVKLPAELHKEPVHCYGQNQFRLYNLPIPMFGKVVGILGRNGIGKSTAIQILAGAITPNFGDFSRNDKASYTEIIGHFKGTEAQVFFEKIRDGKITVSYKPQQVDLIPQSARGTVRELLQNIDEEAKLGQLAEQLELTGFLDTDIGKISGGELQRTAIAATVLKKANLYIFDEPSSYLDIKQRIKMAKFIRGLADEHTAVMVVEHDLVVLDYMTDLIHMMYGDEGSYGIVSQPKASRVGMNVYLSGYLKEENIRFRSKGITFTVNSRPKKLKHVRLTEWKDIHAVLGTFRFSSAKGHLDKGVVTGIVGENGIGKTSFVRILAHDLEAFEGDILEKVTVSYKPQYLTATTMTVMEFLKDAVKNHTSTLIGPLDITPLLMKRLDQLSGGELQRVSVVHCLSAEADLYLLDEPSAYLDVEQRLIISKVIKDFALTRDCSIAVVDHDLVFIDYLSDELLVFKGIPAENGEALGPYAMAEGMNLFLRDLQITLRRDMESKRPRINKPGSQKDQEQRRSGKLYYA